jgi:hypothetical protein
VGTVHASADVESVTIDAVIFRKNGTVEDLGTIAEYHRDQSLLAKAKRKLSQSNRRSVRMADNGPDPGTVLGQYRIQLEYDSGVAHWGRVYNTSDEANADLEAAKEANPDANASVVALVESSTGKTSQWKTVK